MNDIPAWVTEDEQPQMKTCNVCLYPADCKNEGICLLHWKPPSPGDGEQPEVQDIRYLSGTVEQPGPEVVITVVENTLTAVENTLTDDSAARKDIPLCSGLLDYFPDALAAVAQLSKIGNDKHNPGQPLHWSRDKSSDHADCIMRHMLDRGKIDSDGLLHDVKVAWRALAMCQIALEKLK